MRQLAIGLALGPTKCLSNYTRHTLYTAFSRLPFVFILWQQQQLALFAFVKAATCSMQHATCTAATFTDSVNETYFLRLKLMWQKFANAWQLQRTAPVFFYHHSSKVFVGSFLARGACGFHCHKIILYSIFRLLFPVPGRIINRFMFGWLPGPNA